jgi:hypothetical protein
MGCLSADHRREEKEGGLGVTSCVEQRCHCQSYSDLDLTRFNNAAPFNRIPAHTLRHKKVIHAQRGPGRPIRRSRRRAIPLPTPRALCRTPASGSPLSLCGIGCAGATAVSAISARAHQLLIKCLRLWREGEREGERGTDGDTSVA